MGLTSSDSPTGDVARPGYHKLALPPTSPAGVIESKENPMSRRTVLLPLICLVLTLPGRAADKEEGFEPLFKGTDLSAWQGDVENYAIQDGTLVCKGKNLYTKKEYSNFIVRLDFKVPPGGNNGIGLRAPLKGDAAFVGMEIQILDDPAPEYAKIKDYQCCGSLYGVVAAKKGALKPTGEWNSMEITCNGTKVAVTLNGTVIVDADYAPFLEGKTLDGRDHPGLKRTSGHIALLGHGSPVAFRNIRVKELK